MAYIKVKIKQLMTSKKWWFLILCPLLIGLFWGSVDQIIQRGDDTYQIGLVDLDKTKETASLIKSLEEHPSLTVHLYEDRDKAYKALSGKEVLQNYILLEGFEEKIQSEKFDDLIEVVSMLKSPYSDWLNDQISVSTIREWIIGDGYKRISALNPAYSRSMYEEAFDTYYNNNELLTFNIVSRQEEKIEEIVERPFYVSGFLWSWCAYLFLFILVLVRNLHKEHWCHIFKRLRLSGVGKVQYLSIYIILLLLLSLLGGSLSLMGLRLLSASNFISVYQLLSGLFITVLILFLVGYGMHYLPMTVNQLTMTYTSFYLIWCVLTFDVIVVIPGMEVFRWISPIYLFFRFFS